MPEFIKITLEVALIFTVFLTILFMMIKSTFNSIPEEGEKHFDISFYEKIKYPEEFFFERTGFKFSFVDKEFTNRLASCSIMNSDNYIKIYVSIKKDKKTKEPIYSMHALLKYKNGEDFFSSKGGINTIIDEINKVIGIHKNK